MIVKECQNSPPSERWHVFMRQSVETLNVFNTLTLKRIFLKTKAFFKKLENRFLIESNKIENVMSEPNVKTNRMVSTKWTYHKERSLRTSYKELI